MRCGRVGVVLVPLVLGLAGCTLFQAGRLSAPPVRVGLFPQDFSATSRAVIAREANVIVNHGFSWNVMEPTPGHFDFGPADAVDAFARAHHMTEIGMHFAWDQALLDDLPAWVAAIDDPDELRAVLARRAAAIFHRYPHLARLDVINEPLEIGGGTPYRNHFAAVLGDDYITQLFEIVRAAAPPTTQLFVNENFVEYFPDKADGLVALVQSLLRSGVRVDGVGLQSHFLFGEPDFDLLARTGQRLEALGVKVFLSELDVPVTADVPHRDAVQASGYRCAVETCLGWRTCDVINVWGVDDGHTWLDGLLGPGTDPLLFDRGLRPKAAYFAFRSALIDHRRVPHRDH
jgi:endo-1,4-beta-xylanase